MQVYGNEFDFLKNCYETTYFKNMIKNYWKFYNKNGDFVVLNHKCGYFITKKETIPTSEWVVSLNKKKNYYDDNTIIEFINENKEYILQSYQNKQTNLKLVEQINEILGPYTSFDSVCYKWVDISLNIYQENSISLEELSPKQPQQEPPKQQEPFVYKSYFPYDTKTVKEKYKMLFSGYQ